MNHRTFEVRVHGPKEALPLTGEIAEVARRRAQRGRLEVHVWIEGDTGTRATLDHDLAREVFRELSRLRDEVAPGEPVPLSLLAAVPDLFGGGSRGPTEDLRHSVLSAVERSLGALDTMRELEGSALAIDLRGRLDRVRTLTADIASRAPAAVSQQRRRLRERVERLAVDPAVPLDPARLEQEVALLADRTDIAEELTRLGSHGDQLEKILAGGPDAVGRKLDFLLQELGREANTIGAKAQDAGIAHLVIELKAEIERMREQAQNVE